MKEIDPRGLVDGIATFKLKSTFIASRAISEGVNDVRDIRELILYVSKYILYNSLFNNALASCRKRTPLYRDK